MRYCFFLILILCCSLSYGQNCSVKGRLTDDQGFPVEAVLVIEKNTGKRTQSNPRGEFKLDVPCSGAHIEISHPAFTQRQKKFERIDGVFDFGTILMSDHMIDSVNIIYNSNGPGYQPVPKIEPKLFPTIRGNVEDYIKSFGLGVRSNNEMSATYNVRGGSFDENLIYVNDIEIYRPFLVRAGQQEGLSFINADMVQDIYFSSGGFEAKYDDRMSSVLDIRYRKPSELRGTVSAGLLGTNLHLEDISKNHRFTWMIGARYQANGYVLRSMDTKGDYRPRFGDFQTLLTYNITEKLEVSWLNYLASNNYRMVPQTRETDFGTVNQSYRLTVYYEGEEVNLFRTLAQGLTFTYEKDNKTTLKWVNSLFVNDEQENFDVLAAYQLGEVENDPGKDNFGEVAYIKGVGGYLDHARNRLQSYIGNSKVLYQKRLKHATINAGVKYQFQKFEDKISEWNLIDSAGFSTPQTPEDQIILNYVLKAKANLQSHLAAAFIQSRWKWQFNDSIRKLDSSFVSTSSLELVTGVRSNYLSINGQFNIGPRMAIQYIPSWFHVRKGSIRRRNIILRLSGGIYHQPPLYRELRALNGNLNTDLKAQQSIHAIAGADWFFTMWGRTFKYSVEGYYKYLTNLVPYEVDNVRIRYYATNNAKGYATGVDMKINGEFIRGIESWATFSLLQTREDLSDDSYINNYNSDGEKIIPGYTINDSIVRSETIYPGYIPRPADQTMSFALYFQDEMPKIPQFKVHLNLLFATGVPFGPPDNIRYRDTLRGPFYRRVDIGFSYELWAKKDKLRPGSFGTKIDKAFISLEVFNLLGVSNTISYNWIEDTAGLMYAVPNYLTGRRFNLKFLIKF